MARKNYYTDKQFTQAISGCGGIIATVAKRVGCNWQTAKNRIDKSPKLTELFEDEKNYSLDIAESVVMGNIRAALRAQQDAGGTIIADSTDAKWLLSKLGGSRGYIERSAVENTGELIITIVDATD